MCIRDSTDTQYYAERYNQHYQDMVSWIIDKKDDLNIKYVFHTGDIADEFNEEYQFAFARSQQKRLEDAGIPTGVLGGNHDVAHGNMVYDLYWKYFGEEYYKDKSYYGGSYKKMCIRDRRNSAHSCQLPVSCVATLSACLLYTSARLVP